MMKQEDKHVSGDAQQEQMIEKEGKGSQHHWGKNEQQRGLTEHRKNRRERENTHTHKKDRKKIKQEIWSVESVKQTNVQTHKQT